MYAKMGKFLMTGIADGSGHIFDLTAPDGSVKIPPRSTRQATNALGIDFAKLEELRKHSEQMVKDLAEVTANSGKRTE